MSTGLLQDPIFLQHENHPGHPERPERLEAVHAMLQDRGWFSRLELITPRAATDQEILSVHTPGHLELIRSTEDVDSSFLDMDTQANAKSHQVALRAAGGLCVAVQTVWNGRVSNAFSLARPPGHHAESDRAMGFCLFNNVAVAAAFARQELGADRVLIVDWDVHHGNGTQHIFEDDPSVLYFSTHQYPHYPGTGAVEETGRGPGSGYTVNVPLPASRSDADYLAVYTALLPPVARVFRPDLILVSAGFDIHGRDPLAGMDVTEDGCAALARLCLDLANELCQGRIVFTLEGGYDLQALARSVDAVLKEMTGGEAPVLSIGSPADRITDVINRVRAAHPRWYA